VTGRGELTLETKLALDVEYVETAGFWTDVKIVFATVGCVFGRASIYEKKYSETRDTRNGKPD
jgi:lipopolysaccharide/colanic/teichoic acid biosynthesis glycosyltransferase